MGRPEKNPTKQIATRAERLKAIKMDSMKTGAQGGQKIEKAVPEKQSSRQIAQNRRQALALIKARPLPTRFREGIRLEGAMIALIILAAASGRGEMSAPPNFSSKQLSHSLRIIPDANGPRLEGTAYGSLLPSLVVFRSAPSGQLQQRRQQQRTTASFPLDCAFHFGCRYFAGELNCCCSSLFPMLQCFV